MTAKIKLNAASGGGSISIQAPSSSSNNRIITLPDIADGTLVTSQSTLDATKLSGNLPAISGAALTGISAGITMVDSWVITASFNASSAADITSNWAKHSAASSAFGTIGTGMTESSGIFTFPSTGIYMVTHTVGGRCHGSARPYMGIRSVFFCRSQVRVILDLILDMEVDIQTQIIFHIQVQLFMM